MVAIGLGLGLPFAAGSGLPPGILGASLVAWHRSDLGITYVMSAVTATGTAPPAVTLTGTPNTSAINSAPGTPAIEIDITTSGTGPAALFTWKLNGVSQQTGQSCTATFALGTTGLTANFPNSAYTNDNVYKANTNCSAWADQSGNGHNLLQATSANQPIYSLHGGPSSVPAVTGNGTSSFMAALYTLSQPAEFFFVGRFDTAFSVESSLVDGGNTNRARVFRTAATTVALQAGAQPSGTSSDMQTFATWDVQWNGASSILTIRGNQIISGNAGTNNPAGLTILAIAPGTADWAAATMVEVIVANAVVTATQRAGIIAYLQQRYGVT